MEISIIIFFAVNVVMCIANVLAAVSQVKQAVELKKKELTLNKRTENATNTLKNIRKAYEDIIAEIQPLKDEQKNCKRGEWCKTCSFCKKVIIPIYSPFDEVQTIEVCAKGICKEYAQKQGDR
nr:MAG TPA: hypothetical protein [Caudoviricetes sp.]